MTGKDLKDILDKYPEDTVILYRHNQYGRMEIDDANFTEEKLASEKKIYFLTLEATFEEN